MGVTASLQAKIKERQEQCKNSPISSTPHSALPTPVGAFREKPLRTQHSALSTPDSALVNLNTATLEEIEALPGVGPKLAQRIVAARQQKPFASLEDLDGVPGVGPKLLENLRDRVTW